MPLEKAIAQDSFARGMFRGVARHLIPDGGAYDLLNFLLDDEDGSPYRRGGSSYLSSTAAAATGGAIGIWDGRTLGGNRTLIVGDDGTSGILHVASADDSSLTALTLPGANVSRSGVKFSEYAGVVLVTDDGQNPGSYIYTTVYAGSRKALYSTGTVSVTKDTTALTGVGTAWVANADAGMFVTIGNEANFVKSVNSDTSITLLWPHAGATVAGSAYSLAPAVGAVWGGAVAPRGCAEWIAGRVCAIGGENRMVFTGFGDVGQPRIGPAGVGATDYHEFPGRIVGIHGLRDQALVFTTAGLFAVRNMAFDLTDAAGNPQQTVEKLDGMVLWSQQGVQAWGNALVVPARDGVYLVDGISRPVLLSGSINELYRGYVASGYRPGQGAVFRNTYVLPVLDSSLVVQGWLTCRLDAGQDGLWPWTRLSAGAMRCATVRNRASAEPKLLGGGSNSGARLADLRWFDPSSSYRTDADGNAFTYTLETRDYPTGSGQRNTVRKARLRYTLVDGTGTSALSFSYANEDGSFTTHADTAAESAEGSDTWLFTKRGRFARFRVSSSSAADSCSIRSLEAWVRPANRD